VTDPVGDATLPRVGVVGLGNIGGAIAANLAADALAPTIFDADPSKAAAIGGARPASSVAEVAARAEVTITSLPTPEVVDAVADQWAAAAAAGAILVDLSTNLPDGNRRLADRLASSGHRFVEAPLTGGAVGARARSLVFMVGGEDDAVARVRPVLERLGRATFHLGPVGAGTTMKLVNSLVAFASTWSSLEALSLAAAEGLDLRTAVEVVRTGGASNFFIDRVVDGLDVRDRDVQFALALAAKDARLMEELAAANDIAAPVATALAEVLGDAVARGLGDRDWSDLVLAAEARSQRSLLLGPAPADADDQGAR
jgi:3-hydroxyisobutyrate dehydrogenase-like beta-hydroxyacid dehydrogenase